MTADNIVGVDPHRKTFTATVLDSRGGELGHAHFPNTREGHDSGLAWAAGFGPTGALVHDLPEDLRSQLRPAKTVSARVNSLSRLDTSGVTDPTVVLRLRLIEHRVAMLRDVLEQDKAATDELTELLDETNSRLTELVGIAPRAAAEIIVEFGDIRRFTEAGFARFNGTAPIPASSGEGANAPLRHRLSRGGNRRLNAAIYRIAMIQLRYEPRARQIHDQARAYGHTRREAMRVLKRHLSNAIYRTMLRDARRPADLT
jgi:transposase